MFYILTSANALGNKLRKKNFFKLPNICSMNELVMSIKDYILNTK